jgi:hypothetical protein
VTEQKDLSPASGAAFVDAGNSVVRAETTVGEATARTGNGGLSSG